MLTERQWKHLKLLPGTASEVGRKYGMSISGTHGTLSRMEGREVKSWYSTRGRVFELTEMGKRAVKNADGRYK